MPLHPKVVATTVASAGTLIIVYILSQFGYTIPDAVAGAISVLLGFAAGWLTPSSAVPIATPAPAPVSPPTPPANG